MTAPAEDFAQDVRASQAAVMAATQGAVQHRAFDERTRVAAWKMCPSRSIVSANDRIISPELERVMAAKIGATTTTTLPIGHLPQQSRPSDVAAVMACRRNKKATASAVAEETSRGMKA